jgi:hypothetical protein
MSLMKKLPFLLHPEFIIARSVSALCILALWWWVVPLPARQNIFVHEGARATLGGGGGSSEWPLSKSEWPLWPEGPGCAEVTGAENLFALFLPILPEKSHFFDQK